MSTPVVSNALIQCSLGLAPATLSILPTTGVAAEAPVATIQDHTPSLNIPPFGMCTTPTNPQVAAATAAALGVLTPQPCIPITTAPWMPGSPKINVGGVPALTQNSTCMCQWGGVVSITHPGTVKLTV